MKKRDFFIGGLTVTIIPSLIYYTIHFYCDKIFVFTEFEIIKWTIIVVLICVSIALNIIQNHKINKLEYELFHYLQGNREFILDLHEEIKGKEKGKDDCDK